MRGLRVTLGADRPKVLCAHGDFVVPVPLEAQGAHVGHTRCSGHEDQREPELSREPALSQARMGQPRPSLCWSVAQSFRLIVLV